MYCSHLMGTNLHPCNGILFQTILYIVQHMTFHCRLFYFVALHFILYFTVFLLFFPVIVHCAIKSYYFVLHCYLSALPCPFLLRHNLFSHMFFEIGPRYEILFFAFNNFHLLFKYCSIQLLLQGNSSYAICVGLKSVHAF